MINLTYYPASHFCGNFGDLTATVPFPGIMSKYIDKHIDKSQAVCCLLFCEKNKPEMPS